MSDRTPGYGELMGRLDDIERENASQRNMILVVLALGLAMYLDLKMGKRGGDD